MIRSVFFLFSFWKDIINVQGKWCDIHIKEFIYNKYYRFPQDSPLREVELSCRFGIVLAGGQKVFFGTGNHVVFSPSLRWDSSKINFPSLKNFKRPPGVGSRLLSIRASVWWAGWGLEFLPFALARVGCNVDGSREHISVVPLTWAAWAWHSADFSRMLILYRYPFSSTWLLIL